VCSSDLCVISLLFFLIAQNAISQDIDSAEKSPLTLDDLAWMTGTWAMEQDNEHAEVTWSSAVDGAMIGMFRWTRNGKLIVYEFLAVREFEGELQLLMRHLNDDFTVWEKNNALKYRVTASGDQRVAFFKDATADNASTVRLEYVRKDQVMDANVEITTGDAVDKFTITYTRKP